MNHATIGLLTVNLVLMSLDAVNLAAAVCKGA